MFGPLGSYNINIGEHGDIKSFDHPFNIAMRIIEYYSRQNPAVSEIKGNGPKQWVCSDIKSDEELWARTEEAKSPKTGGDDIMKKLTDMFG